MKRLATLIGVPLGLALLLAQCDDVLDTEPLGTLTDQTFYQTEKDFDAATLGPYSTVPRSDLDLNPNLRQNPGY